MIKRKNLLATSLGNILEWCDFGLFIFLAPILGQHFFPLSSPSNKTLAAFIVFAAGFICRPFGGILFGYWGDTYGRAKTLRRSMLTITIATFFVGCLPSYQTLGFLSTFLFIIARISQGLSAGGEYSGVMIYLVESASQEKKGLITSFAASGASLGFFLATLAILVLKVTMSTATMTQWGWRIPFLVLGLIGSFILYFRFQIPETETFLSSRFNNPIKQIPLLTALRTAPKSLLKIIGITSMSSTFYFIFFGFMPKYLSQYSGIPLKTGFMLQSFLLLIMLFLLPIGGMMGDRFGRKNILLIVAFSIIIFAYPCFYVLQQHQIAPIILFLIIATILSSLDQSSNLTAFVENCPIEVRYSGIAFAYNLGNAIFGATTPLVLSVLIGKINPLAPAYYLMATATISFLSIMTLLNKRKSYILQKSI